MKLIILFLEYDKVKYPNSFDKLKFFVNKLKGYEKEYFIIDNAKSGDGIEKISENVHRLAGDNSAWEFSGLQKGLEYLRSNFISYEAILFANDSFLVNGWTLLDGLDSRYLAKLLRKDLVVGQIDSHNITIKAFNKDVTRWVCTNCFFFPKTAMDKIDTLVSVNKQELDSLVDENYTPGKFFRDDAPISEEYRSLLIEWLTHRWHSSFEINENNWNLFRNKN